MDPLCIDGVPMLDVTLSASQAPSAKKKRIRRPMVKPKPPGRATVRTGYEETLEKARKVAQKLLDRRDIQGAARPIACADAGAIIRQAEILEEKAEEKYEVNFVTGKDDKRAQRKIARHCKDACNLLTDMQEGRWGDFPRYQKSLLIDPTWLPPSYELILTRFSNPREAGRIMYEWKMRSVSRVIQRWRISYELELVKFALVKQKTWELEMKLNREHAIVSKDMRETAELLRKTQVRDTKQAALRAFSFATGQWACSFNSFEKTLTHRAIIEWQLLTEIRRKEDAAEALRHQQVSDLTALFEEAVQKSEELNMSLNQTMLMRDTLDENCRLLSERLKEVVKSNILEVHELSAACQSAILSSEQLRVENQLKSDALIRTRNDRASALEALVLKKKEAERCRRVEKRVESLYEDAVTALEEEQGAHQELNNSVTRVHQLIVKVYQSMEGFMKRLRLAGNHPGKVSN